MLAQSSLLALSLVSSTLAASAGSFSDGGNTKISAMMMFVGNEEKVYIMDKAEENLERINDHPAWGGVWDINTHNVDLMEIRTNVFCASGMHLPNGSFVTFGGNGAIGPGGNVGSEKDAWGNGLNDATWKDLDGTKAIRVLNPCTSADDLTDPKCQWFDDPTLLSMQKKRWYAGTEPLADGTIAVIGGFVNGGYVNRNCPATSKDPATQDGAAEPTYEFFPSDGKEAQRMNFMVKTAGLSAYAHTFLMPSGKMFLQANVSTILWDPLGNVEFPLPDMPGNVVRVYPASGAVAMLPLTPANNYTPTVIFCGGTDMNDEQWGNYSYPLIDTWLYPASKDCQRITPEPEDGSAPVYEQDDDMLDRRTMGQFVILPDGKLLVVNGAENGTAGYAESNMNYEKGQMPLGQSLADGPVGTPSIYDPSAPKGSRWSSAGLGTSNIPRLYHSGAILLPDSSVLIAGSNPNINVNTSTIFPTTYQAEIFYPPYFASSRPVLSGMPKTLSYGGASFDITLPANSYVGSANEAAQKTHVSIVRPGFTTHAMNMGQRYMQLKNTFTVNTDATITLHVAQAHPNPNVFQPGPALMFVVVDGVPSNGTNVILGSGKIEKQPTLAESTLPVNVLAQDSVKGSGTPSSTATTGGGNKNGAVTLRGGVLGGLLAAIAALSLLC